MLGKMNWGGEARRLVVKSRRQAPLEFCAAIAAKPIGQRNGLAALGAGQD
jgi:hypothetical protein